MNTEKFNSLSPKQQRILVAKDVVAQVNARRYKAIRQNYVRISDRASRQLLGNT